MENRIEELEQGHKSLRQSLTEMLEQQKVTSSAVELITMKMDLYFKSEDKTEKLLAHIDENVQQLTMAFARIPHESDKAIKEAIEPLWVSIRKQDRAIQDFKLDVAESQRIRKTEIIQETWERTRTHVGIIWAAAVIIFAMAGYIYTIQTGSFDKRLVAEHKHAQEIESRLARQVEQHHRNGATP